MGPATPTRCRMCALLHCESFYKKAGSAVWAPGGPVPFFLCAVRWGVETPPRGEGEGGCKGCLVSSTRTVGAVLTLRVARPTPVAWDESRLCRPVHCRPRRPRRLPLNLRSGGYYDGGDHESDCCTANIWKVIGVVVGGTATIACWCVLWRGLGRGRCEGPPKECAARRCAGRFSPLGTRHPTHPGP